MRKWSTFKDYVVFAVCEQFLAGKKAPEIMKIVHKTTGVFLNREQVYPLFAEARDRGFLRLCPPISTSLVQRLQDRFRTKRFVRVVEAKGHAVDQHVADVAAEVAFDEICRLGEKKKKARVHIGLGAGWTTKAVAHSLGERLRAEAYAGPLTFHALGAGFSVAEPSTSPVALFSFFDGLNDTEFVGLFAPPYARSTEHRGIMNLPGVKESFARKSEIDIVITALASKDDQHGEFSRFMQHQEIARKAKKVLNTEEWVGDVQYRPYSRTAPIVKDLGLRPVTLFELKELVELAEKPDKSVILVAGPCRFCGENRSAALLPLLEEPDLAVWSHLVTDVGTATDCLELQT